MFCLKRKKVSFDPYITVILLPDTEYTNKLWWSSQDIYYFKESSKIELRRLQTIHPSMSFQQACKLLYQPPSMTIIYDINNFI